MKFTFLIPMFLIIGLAVDVFAEKPVVDAAKTAKEEPKPTRKVSSEGTLCEMVNNGAQMLCDVAAIRAATVEQFMAIYNKLNAKKQGEFMAWFTETTKKGHHARRGEWEYKINLLNENAKGFSKEQIRDINQRVALEVANGRCRPDKFTPIEMKSSYASVVPLFANSAFISYQIGYNSFCGGAHPSGGTYPIYIDAKTGRKFEIKEHFNNLETYIKKTIVPLIKAQGMKEHGTDQDCGYNSPDGGAVFGNDPTFYSFSVEGDKLVVGNSLPHVIQACEVEIEISRKDPTLKNYIKSGTALYHWLNRK